MILTLIAALIGGILFRMRGGWPDIPRPIEQVLFCAPVIYICFVAFGYWGILLAALSVIAVVKRHGNNIDLGTWDGPSKDAWYEFTIKWAKPYMSLYWYDALGMAVSGLTYTLPMILINPVLGLSGILKAPAYMLGWFMHPRYNDGRIKLRLGKFTLECATEWGEFFTGAFLWAVFVSFLIDNIF